MPTACNPWPRASFPDPSTQASMDSVVVWIAYLVVLPACEVRTQVGLRRAAREHSETGMQAHSCSRLLPEIRNLECRELEQQARCGIREHGYGREVWHIRTGRSASMQGGGDTGSYGRSRLGGTFPPLAGTYPFSRSQIRTTLDSGQLREDNVANACDRCS